MTAVTVVFSKYDEERLAPVLSKLAEDGRILGTPRVERLPDYIEVQARFAGLIDLGGINDYIQKLCSTYRIKFLGVRLR